MNAVIIICTRPESSRLPDKVFRQVAGVKAIDHILNRLKGCGIPVVLAIPLGCTAYEQIYAERQTSPADLSVSMFYGDPDSPLHRMAACVEAMPETPKWIIRITHDDILIDQQTMLDLLKACDEGDDIGYGISPKIVDGAGVEVIRTENLLQAARDRRAATEFISYFVKTRPHKNVKVLEPREGVCRAYRLTMDYYQDWLVLDTVLGQVGAGATLDQICKFIDRHPYMMDWNKQPLVTFYTCVKNGKPFIRQAMHSVMNGSPSVDFEYIVIDDGSVDETAVIVSEFAYNPRVRFFKNRESIGLASSSNIAIDKARGKYIIRVDADDILAPHAIKTMIEKIEADQSGAVYSAYHECTLANDITRENVQPYEVHHAGCALFSHKLINEIRFTDGLRHFDGADLHKRIKDRVGISYIQKPLWLYRRHEKNLSNSDPAERARVRADLELGNATATSLAV